MAARKRTADAELRQQSEQGRTGVWQGTDPCIRPLCRNRRDWWMPFLMKRKSYTLETVDRMIETYQKGQVR